MKRRAEANLIAWKDTPHRRPMLISGVRQCGKTYLMEAFGEAHFSQTVKFNFEKEPGLGDVFLRDYDPERIVKELGLLTLGRPIKPNETLIIFDEIQACPHAITALKYFAESKEDYYILCAGSLLGVEMRRSGISFPVGKVDRLQMYPMCFREFVTARGGEHFLEWIEQEDPCREIPSYVTGPMLRYLKEYYIVGGMPAVVRTWIETEDFSKVDEQQDAILRDFRDDFSNHAEGKDILRIGWIWDSVAKQLAKENQKFVFSHVKSGTRARDLEDALTWLVDAGLVYRQERVTHPEIPLSACADATAFKLYMADTGLLRRKAGLAPATILTEPEQYISFKGAMTENYCMQELKAQDLQPYYWKNENTSEVDFLLEMGGNIVPAEAKSAERTRAKSFGNYLKRYEPELGFRFSRKNVGENQKGRTREISLPLYLIWRLQAYA